MVLPNQRWPAFRGQRAERSVSPSVKRKRIEDGAEAVDERSRSKSQQRKFVVGTSSSAQSGRKMRSPPADIFVYGVHPETSIEDIVADLAVSDIQIDTKDVVVKSKEDAYLKSYKISVRAEDLQKALDPAIWPMRVKVREYIYYSRRQPRQAQGDADKGVGHGGQNQVGNVSGQGGRGQLSGFLAPNKYALPGDQVPGGPQV